MKVGRISAQPRILQIKCSTPAIIVAGNEVLFLGKDDTGTLLKLYMNKLFYKRKLTSMASGHMQNHPMQITKFKGCKVLPNLAVIRPMHEPVFSNEEVKFDSDSPI